MVTVHADLPAMYSVHNVFIEFSCKSVRLYLSPVSYSGIAIDSNVPVESTLRFMRLHMVCHMVQVPNSGPSNSSPYILALQGVMTKCV